MRIAVDYDLRRGHAACEGEALEVFELDDDGYLTILCSVRLGFISYLRGVSPYFSDTSRARW